MHSSAAVATARAPLASAQGFTSVSPVDVSITPLPLRSSHWPFSSRPMWSTLPQPSKTLLRFVSQTLPSASTVVREGLPALWLDGVVRYLPSTAPVSVSIFTAVPSDDTAIQMNPNGSVVSSS